MIYDDFKLNIYDLHHEWMRLASVSFQHHEAYSFAAKEAGEAKIAADTALADAMNFVMENYEDFKLNKGQLNSSTFVRNKAMGDENYQRAYHEWLDKEQKAERLKGASYATVTLRTSLEGVTKLFLQGYYSADNILPEARVEAVDRKEFEQEMANSLKQNPRMRRRIKHDISDEKS